MSVTGDVAVSVPRRAVAVVGFPNVGKSTLVNRLAGVREAVTDAEAGVTRDRKRLPCDWNGAEFELIDTGGIDLADEAELSRDVQDQARAAIDEAAVVLLVVDARAGLRPGDDEAAKILRGAPVPVIVVANKVDRPSDVHLPAEFNRMGLGEPMPVSASHGIGTGDLLDRIVEALGEEPEEVPADDAVQIAVIGRPNVGKSSLVNKILGIERVIVSPKAGTTRDAIDTRVEVGGRPAVLIDTAGLRRRGKIGEAIDYYAQLRAERSAERADVAIVVCDSADGVTSEDLRVTELAMRSGCAVLLALNKWDITRTDIEDARARVARKSRLRPQLVTCSALTGRGIASLLGRAIELADRRALRIPTPELNRFVGDVVSTTPPPARRGKRLRLYYSAQVGDAPPRIAIQVNDRRLITQGWAYHLENRLRDAYSLEGVPLIIDFIPKNRESRR